MEIGSQVQVHTPQGPRVGFLVGEHTTKKGKLVYDLAIWSGHEFGETYSMKGEAREGEIEPLDSAAWLSSFGARPDVTAWVEGAHPAGWQHVIGLTKAGAQVADAVYSDRVKAAVPFENVFVGRPPAGGTRERATAHAHIAPAPPPHAVEPVHTSGRGVRYDAGTKRYIITEGGRDTAKWFSSQEKAQDFAGRAVRSNPGVTAYRHGTLYVVETPDGETMWEDTPQDLAESVRTSRGALWLPYIEEALAAIQAQWPKSKRRSPGYARRY